MTGCCFQRLAIESISIHCSISFQNSSRAPQTIDFHIPSRPRHLRQRCVSPVFTWPLSWLLFTRSALQPQRLRTSARPYPRPRRLLQRLLCFVQRKRRAFVLARRAVGTICERRGPLGPPSLPSSEKLLDSFQATLTRKGDCKTSRRRATLSP